MKRFVDDMTAELPKDAIFRLAISADARSLGHLGALLMSIHHEFDAPRFMAASERTPSAYADFLESQMVRSDVVVLVAEMNGRVAGYVYAGSEGADYMALRGPAGVIYDLIVDPTSRRQGIGRKLLQRAVFELGNRGVQQFVLSTAARNEAAQSLFASMGFRPTMIEMTRDDPV